MPAEATTSQQRVEWQNTRIIIAPTHRQTAGGIFSQLPGTKELM